MSKSKCRMSLRYAFICIAIAGMSLISFSSCNSDSDILPVMLPEPERQHEGVWEGKDTDGRLIQLRMTAEGTADILINKSSVMKSLNAVTCLYIIDYRSEPVKLDLEFMTKYFEVTEIKMRLDFLGPTMMRVWTEFNDTDPTDKDRMFVLKRKR